jgi:serine/threonine-protein kinase
MTDSSSQLSHYHIVSKIAAGGMGEVYLAQDKKLDRKVALKILRRKVASNHDRMELFVREAKTAAALNHPNIAHIYEIGESHSFDKFSDKWVEGPNRVGSDRESNERRRPSSAGNR